MHNINIILKYLFEDVIKNLKIVLSNILHTLTGGIAPILSIYILKVTLNYMIFQNISFNKFIYQIIALSITLAIFEITTDQIENRTYSFFNLLRMNKVTETIEFFNAIDYKYFENSKFMDKETRVFRAVSSNNIGVEGIYHRSFELGRKLLCSFIISIIIIKDINFYPILVVCVSSALSLLINKKSITLRYKYSTEINSIKRKLDIFNNEASDFRYSKDMRIYGGIKKFNIYINNTLINYYNLLKKSFKENIKYTSFSALNDIFCFAIVVWIIVSKIYIDSKMVFFMYYYLLLRRLISEGNEIIEDISFITEESKYVYELIDLLENEEYKQPEIQSLHSDISAENLELKFENVSFKYPNSNEFVLENITFSLSSNEKLAIVGVNGSGKTTLIKLLSGLYRPTSGKILINGEDYNNYTFRELTQLISVVFQDSELTAFTIREFISSSHNNIDDELVNKNLKYVGLWDKVSSLDKKIYSMLTKAIDNDGIIFSGGESNKLIIARALYKQNSKIIIFDEPTASLDAISEENLYKEFTNWTNNKSTIFISHRLASTQFCDTIIIVNQGQIESKGTHSQLYMNCDLYRDMFDMQGKYYIGGKNYEEIEYNI